MLSDDNIEDYKRRAFSLYEEGRYEEARPLYIKVRDFYLQKEQWEEYAKMGLQAEACSFLCGEIRDKIIEALNLLLDTATIHTGNNRLVFSDIHNLLGTIYLELGRFQDAYKHTNKELQITLAVQGENYPYLLYTYSNLANCCIALHKGMEALSYLNEGLDLIDRLTKQGLSYPVDIAIRLYDNIGSYHYTMREFKPAITYYEKMISTVQQYPEFLSELPTAYTNIGACYGEMGRRETELNIYEKAIDIIKQENLGDVFLMDAYHNKSVAYGDMNLFDKQLEFANKSLEIKQKKLSEKHSKLADSYNTFAWCYLKLGDFQRGKTYADKALSIRKETYRITHQKTADSYNLLGMLNGRLGNFSESISFVEAAIDIVKKLKGENKVNDDKSLSYYYDNLAWVYLQQQQYTKALENYTYSLKLRTVNDNENIDNKALVAKSYFAIGKCLMEENKDLSNAELQLKKSLETALTLKNISPSHVFNVYHQLALLYTIKEQAAQALKYFDKADTYIKEVFENEDALGFNTGIQQLLFECYRDKACLYLQQYQVSNKTGDLENAAKFYEQSVMLIEKIRLEYQSEAAKIQFSETVSQVFEQAIHCNFLLSQIHQNNTGYLTKVFDLIEKNKSAALMSDFASGKTKDILGMPRELLERENLLLKKIAYYDQKINELRFAQPKDRQEDLDYFKERRFQIFSEYEKWQQKIKEEYTGFAQLRFKETQIDIKGVQQVLKANEALLNYVKIGEGFYVFVLTQNKFRFFKLPDTSLMENDIRRFISVIRKLQIKPFKESAYSLYQKLLLHLQSFLDEENIQHLNIIPDRSLFLLPFSALLYKPADDKIRTYKDLPYVLNRYCISYHYSVGLWLKIRNRRKQKNTSKQKQAYKFLGLAPNYELWNEQQKDGKPHSDKTGSQIPTNLILPPLKYPKQEVNEVAAMFDNKQHKAMSLVEQEATLENFNRHAPDADYLLISAHGYFNKDLPKLSGIIFTPESILTVDNTDEELEKEYEEVLTVSDAYHLRLKADLVVLGSCESGQGQLWKGEGPIALNRSFLYAGANNIVYTLFKVRDKSSYHLIKQLFFHILDSSQEETSNYAFALQKAKQSFVTNSIYTPFDWAGFVLLGV